MSRSSVRRPHLAPRVATSLVVPVVLLGALALPTPSRAKGSLSPVTLRPSLPSGQPVGTTMTWIAAVAGGGAHVYRFSVGPAGGPRSVVRDFSPSASFSWTPLQEGSYTVEVTARQSFTATTGITADATFAVTARATGSTPVVGPTANPLVALYSAPACAAGRMLVQFRPAAAGTAPWTSTSAQPCRPGQSLNFLVAGMRARTSYVLRSVVVGPARTTTSGPTTFTTGSPPSTLQFPTFTVRLAPGAQSDHQTPLLIHLLVPQQPNVANPIATDLSGTVVWYYNVIASGLTAVWPVNVVPGGLTLLFGRDADRSIGDDVLREIDAAGDPVRETNVDAINAQLAARGLEPIYAFHHDALSLPNGDIAVLGATERTSNGRSIEGDMLLVLDTNLQIVWSWDAFAHLDPAQWPPSDTGDCANSSGSAGCALPNPQAEDWLHTNSIGWSPADGDLVLSMRNQDWVVKIDYRAGRGSGAIVWRLGKGGDFVLSPPDASLWFSHQHNAYYIDAHTLVVFDDGNTRCATAGSPCDSRGQALDLDEQRHYARVLLNADLGDYSAALGSAQRLPNGDYAFGSGLEATNPVAQVIEVSPTGTPVYVQGVSTYEYRAYRECSLYQGTAPEGGACRG